MKRIDLVRHLESHGCELLREGGGNLGTQHFFGWVVAFGIAGLDG